jgi:peptide/nickel transport system substrate-binding protein
MGAVAPIPPNPFRPDAPLGAAQGHDDGYGRFLVATGPYMVEGSEDLDLSRPAARQVPIAGYRPVTYDEEGNATAPGSLSFVRNPSWDPATDLLRAAFPDRIELEFRGETYQTAGYRATSRELRSAVDDAAVDLVLDLPLTLVQAQRYFEEPATRERVLSVPTGTIQYLVMRLAVPPFDDLHVRRAVAYALDEEALVGRLAADPSRFGEARAVPFTHLAPDSLEADLLADYDPFPASLERAGAEMARSRYDADGDGRCDAAACTDVLTIVNAESAGPEGAAVVEDALDAIGIGVRPEILSFQAPGSKSWYGRFSDLSRRDPMLLGLGWGLDYPNASTVLGLMFDSAGLAPTWGSNLSLVGASPSQLRRWGYGVTRVPSADAWIDRCASALGTEQIACWAQLDGYLMERITTMVPYLGLEQLILVSARVATPTASVPPFLLAIDRISLGRGSG